ncbi:MAG: acetate kinase [Cyanobacteria bacterium P01_A01_bin.45]
MKILILNAGSSSHKICLYKITAKSPSLSPPLPLWESKIDWTHRQGIAELEVKTSTGASLQKLMSSDSRADVMSYCLKTITEGNTKTIDRLSEIDAVGHRVVHGGKNYRESVVITEEVKKAIAKLSELAPAHNPANLAGIELMEEYLTDVPQFAVFDTAFHSTLTDEAAVYPLPYEWLEKGIKRYGFHGISHHYCTRRSTEILGKDINSLKLVICHLGNGCSLSAVRNGYSIDTTMGFTPLDGLMMGSRCGSVDPGILIYLLKQSDYSVTRLEQILNQESGLKGISGISNDLRQVFEASQEGNKRAQLALSIYIHRLNSGIGAMVASLGGLDVLVFTAGVGENSAIIRQKVCENWQFLGLQLDNKKNNSHPQDTDIAQTDSKVRVLVIQTQEDWAIAQECWRLLNS